jgi:hypothetical protein
MYSLDGRIRVRTYFLLSPRTCLGQNSVSITIVYSKGIVIPQPIFVERRAVV